jgi:hypothetical protein
MTDIDTDAARLAGAALVLVVPFVLAAGAVMARGGFASGAFWASERDRKLDHIADHVVAWQWMYVVWFAILAAATGGVTAFALLLARAGEDALAGIGLGLFLLGVLGWLGGIFLQAGPAVVAARIRRETGATPGWLEPLWAAVGWAEPAYIVLASGAYVVWGAAILESGFPSNWAGWVSVVVGGLALAGMAAARDRVTIPELPLLVPVVLGVALVLR